jgi:hypothetical protein
MGTCWPAGVMPLASTFCTVPTSPSNSLYRSLKFRGYLPLYRTRRWGFSGGCCPVSTSSLTEEGSSTGATEVNNSVAFLSSDSSSPFSGKKTFLGAISSSEVDLVGNDDDNKVPHRGRWTPRRLFVVGVAVVVDERKSGCRRRRRRRPQFVVVAPVLTLAELETASADTEIGVVYTIAIHNNTWTILMAAAAAAAARGFLVPGCAVDAICSKRDPIHGLITVGKWVTIHHSYSLLLGTNHRLSVLSALKAPSSVTKVIQYGMQPTQC